LGSPGGSFQAPRANFPSSGVVISGGSLQVPSRLGSVNVPGGSLQVPSLQSPGRVPVRVLSPPPEIARGSPGAAALSSPLSPGHSGRMPLQVAGQVGTVTRVHVLPARIPVGARAVYRAPPV